MIGDQKDKTQASEQGRKFNRVLVLAGGGAKGAYAYGCLQAFRHYKIRFDAVAGTSVGALNALIWATGAFEQGDRLWKELSFATVYPLRLPTRIPRWALRIVATLFVIVNLLKATLSRLPTPGAVIWQVVSVVLFIIGPCALGFLASRPDPTSKKRTVYLLAFLLIAMSLLGFSSLRSRKLNGHLVFVGVVGTALTVPTLVLADRLLPGGIGGVRWYWSFVALSAALLTVVGSTIAGCFLLSKVLGPNASILSAAPLRQHIAEILEAFPVKVPCFVTVARKADVFDPDEGKWYTPDVDAKGMARPGSRWQPDLEAVWLPEYIQIEEIPPQSALDFCLASAALPFGIVPNVQIGSTHYVDGGVIDNVPFYPFVQEFPTTEIFVILLSPHSNDPDAMTKTQLTIPRWRKINRAREVAAFAPPEEVKGPIALPPRMPDLPFSTRNRPPKIIKFKEPEYFPKFVMFYPKRSLGSFLSGTLNFNGRYAEKIRQRGFEDTCERLRVTGLISGIE